MVYACAGLLRVWTQSTCDARHGFSVNGKPLVRPAMTNWVLSGGIGRSNPPTLEGHCGHEMSCPNRGSA